MAVRAITIGAGANNGSGVTVETVVINETQLDALCELALANPNNRYTMLLNGEIVISNATRTGTINTYAGNASMDGSTVSILLTDIGRDVEFTGAGAVGTNLIATVRARLNGNAISVDKKTASSATAVAFRFIKTIPANITIRRTNGGKFTQGTNGTSLSIHGTIIADPALLFKDFEAGNLRLDGATENYYFEWFGAKGDARTDSAGGSLQSGTDDLAALNLALASVETTLAVNNSTIVSGRFTGGAGKLYYCSDSLHVRKAIGLLGTGGGGESVNTGIWFAPNKEGLVFHTSNSENAFETPSSSDRSYIKNFGVFTNLTPNHISHQLTITPRPITNNAPDMFSDISIQSGESLTSPTINGIRTVPGMSIHKDGNVFTILRPSGGNLEINPITANAAVVMPVTVMGNFVIATKRFNTVYQNLTWVGGKLNIQGNIFTILSRDATGLVLSNTVYNISNNATYNAADVFSSNLNGEEALFQPPTLISGGALVANKSGVVAYSRIIVDGAAVKSFSGAGILFSGSAFAPNGQNGLAYISNSNYSAVRDTLIKSNLGSGTHTYGRNANNISFANNDSTDNKSYNYLDFSDLGCNYFGNHASSSLFGNYRSLGGGENRSWFFGNYGEVSVVPNFIGQKAAWFGGNDGGEPAFSKLTEGQVFTGGVQGAWDSSLPIRGVNSMARSLGNAYEQPTITSKFGASQNRLMQFFSLLASNDTSGGYQMDYGNGADGLDGYYCFRAFAGGSGNRTHRSDVFFAVSGSAAINGVKQFLFPNGFKSKNVQFDDDDALPVASVSFRGQMRIVKGANGAADTIKVCLKNAADIYVWTTVATS